MFAIANHSTRNSLVMKQGNASEQRGRRARFHAESAGFTLLELMIVITIILILGGIAVGRYEQSVLHAKEATLKQDLSVMRQAIQQYTLDKQMGPTSLDDLVQAQYLGAIPTDPIARTKNWTVEYDNVLLTPEQTAPGITDVHSTSNLISPFDNTPYSSW